MRSLAVLLLFVLSAGCASPHEEAKAPHSDPAKAAGSALTAPGVVETSIAIGPVVDYALTPDGICFVERSGKAGCAGDNLPDYSPPNLHYFEGVQDAKAIHRFEQAIRVLRADGRLTSQAGETVAGGASRLFPGCMLDGAKTAVCGHYTLKVEDAVHASAGENHACFVTAKGTVFCAGSNGYGQLGIGSGSAQGNPDMPPAGPAGLDEVPGVVDATAVAAGSEHTCALLKSGEVDCWGSGYQGNTGPGAAPKRGTRTRVAGIDDAVEIAASSYGWTTCALRKSGVATCWGSSGAWSRRPEAQLLALPAVVGAHKLTVDRDKVCVLDRDGAIQCIGSLPPFGPVRLAAPTGVKKVVLNDYRACALTDSKEVFCWGRFRRYPGPNTSEEYLQLRPTRVAQGALDIFDGLHSAVADFCIVTEAREVRCFDDGHRPFDIPGTSDAVEVALGHYHLCARSRDGTVACWGSNEKLQLGLRDDKINSREGDSIEPAVRVAGLGPATRVAAGNETSCALVKDGQVFCWGRGELLGDSTPPNEARHEPKPIPNLRARDVSLGNSLGCAVDLDGKVRCWGSGMEMPRKSLEDPPLEVGAPRFIDIAGASEIDVGPVSCAISSSKTPTCWGVPAVARFFSGKGGQGPHAWPLGDVRSVASAGKYMCIVLGDGTLRCAGEDEYATLGRGSHDRWTKAIEIRR